MADKKQDIINSDNDAQNFLNNNTPLSESRLESYKKEGFALPPTFSADANGLPYSKVNNERNPYRIKRNIISWFVPDFGIVKMYVNPSSITYIHNKKITPTLTKGGYTLQYWGEDLTKLGIRGTTGTSGIEGINALYEVYRSEQYSNDTVGLLASSLNSNSNPLNTLTNNIFSPQTSALISSFGGLAGFDSPNNSLLTNNLNSMAKSAFSVEMYYSGWVYRGFFTDMNIEEKAENFLFEYTINFTVTQRRGYRTNYQPWHRSAKDGPSQWTTPYSFAKNK